MSESEPASSKASQPPKGQRLRRLRRAWSWYNRAHSGYGWLGWLLGGKTGAVVGITALAGLAGVTGIAVTQPDLLPSLFNRSVPVAVVTQQWDDSIVFPIEGHDKAGRKAAFDVVVKTRNITWVHGSADQLAKSGQPISDTDIATQLFGPEVRQGLARSADVIAVGAASEEGTESEETTRAERRGRTAGVWLAQALSPQTHIWVLNLGQFRPSCAVGQGTDTSWERPFMIIGVRQQVPGVDLGEALRSAMAGKTNLPSTQCYSRYELAKLN